MDELFFECTAGLDEKVEDASILWKTNHSNFRDMIERRKELMTDHRMGVVSIYIHVYCQTMITW